MHDGNDDELIRAGLDRAGALEDPVSRRLVGLPGGMRIPIPELPVPRPPHPGPVPPVGGKELELREFGGRFSDLADAVTAWLDGWKRLRLPEFVESRHLHPADRGWFQTYPIRGGFAFTGSIVDELDTEPPSYWSTTWTTFSRLLAAPRSGRMFYRFRVRGSVHGVSDAAFLSVANSAYFGVVGDADSTSPFFVPGFNLPIAAPIRAVLGGARGTRRVTADGDQTIEGSIEVTAGKTPAIALVLGTDILLQDGFLELERASMCRNLVEGIGPGAGSGVLEYRFEPAEIVALTPSFDRDLLGG